MKILIAENDYAFNMIYQKLMARWGFDFDFVSSGEEAINKAIENEGQYDLCLMDVETLKMNGYKATRIIRKKTKYLPIIALTDCSPSKNYCYESCMDGFIKKPFDFNKLFNVINEFTIKIKKIVCNDKEVYIKKEMPMDQQHAQELRKLKEQNLIKMRLDGPEQHEVIVHENTPNKISYDFNQKRCLMTEFLNRDPDRPTLCDLYRGSRNCIVETFLDEDDYAKKLTSEDLEMAKYTKKIYKPEED